MTGAESARSKLRQVGEAASAALEQTHAARETGIEASRKAIQLSSRAIRAAHRGEFAEASVLSREAGQVLRDAAASLADQPAVLHAGFMLDGEKEYAESALTIAFVSGGEVPGPADLEVTYPAYLNGLAEAASELRRSALDAIRAGDVARADTLLSLMDEAMAVLTTIDFPEGVTGGLRRTTDQLRAVTERTRGDVTAALGQAALDRRLASVESRLERDYRLSQRQRSQTRSNDPEGAGGR